LNPESLIPMKLYHYWRSTSSWRVRWALAYKNIPAELVHISLLNGESESPEHLARHPAGFVPVLELDDGTTLIESLAIINYLENNFKDRPSLYPSNPLDRARALALAEVINAGIHPLQNPPVTALLGSKFGATPEQQTEWNQHWIRTGLALYESLLSDGVLNSKTPTSLETGFSVADVCLMPQLYNAHRYNVDLSGFPKIQAIEQHLSSMDTYHLSHPDRTKPVGA
jgi:maleylacetoacetate isomerase